MTRDTPIHVVGYSPDTDDLPDRMARVVQALEQELPGTTIDHAAFEDDYRPLRDLPGTIRQELTGTGWFLIGNSDERRAVTLEGHRLTLPHAPPLLYSVVKLPTDIPTDALTRYLERSMEHLDAHWGIATPYQAAVVIGRQVHDHTPGFQPPLGLPTLKALPELPDPTLPQRLGWMNYWSANTARKLGVDDRVTSSVHRAHRLPNGAVSVTLTAEPLDLDRADHVEKVHEFYRLLPRIGRG